MMLAVAATLALSALAPPAHASGPHAFRSTAARRAAAGHYRFDGGTPSQRGQVRAALAASAFDWSLVPAELTIHISPGLDSEAAPGEIWLDADLLDSGSFSWGVVQHEYAHQVDFFLLDNYMRAALLPQLGGTAWWPHGPRAAHEDAAGERFASTLAWSYWPSSLNVMSPDSVGAESGSIAPARFRRLLARLLAARASSP